MQSSAITEPQRPKWGSEVRSDVRIGISRFRPDANSREYESGSDQRRCNAGKKRTAHREPNDAEEEKYEHGDPSRGDRKFFIVSTYCNLVPDR